MTTVALHGSFNLKEKSLDQVTLSLGLSESQVKRLSQQILSVVQDAEGCKDPEPATREVSGHVCTSTLHRNHVSEANLTSRNFANPQAAKFLNRQF